MGQAQKQNFSDHSSFFTSEDERFYHALIAQRELYEQNMALFQLMNGLHDAQKTEIKGYINALKTLKEIDSGFAELKAFFPRYYFKLKEKSQTLAREYDIHGAHSAMLLEILCNGPLCTDDEREAPIIIYKLLWSSTLANKKALASALPLNKGVAEVREKTEKKKALDYLLAIFFGKRPLLKEASTPLFNWSAKTLDAIFRLDLQQNHHLMQQLLATRKIFKSEFAIISKIFRTEMAKSPNSPLLQFNDGNIQLFLYILSGSEALKNALPPYPLFLIQAQLSFGFEKTLQGSKEAKAQLQRQLTPLVRSGLI